MVDNNIGGASVIDKVEDPASILSTLSDKLGAMDVITDKIDSLAEVYGTFLIILTVALTTFPMSQLHPYAKIAWTVCSSLYQVSMLRLCFCDCIYTI